VAISGVVSGISSIGILQDGQKRWHRVREDDRLPVGWRVIAMDEKELVIALGDACEPKQWQWQREGTGKNENQDNALADDTQPSGVGGTPKPVNLVVDDVPVVQVLQALAAQEERNLVVSPDVSGTLSLNLTRVPWRQALNTVVASAGLILREERGFFTSTPRPGSASKRRVRSRNRSSGSLMRHCYRAVFPFHMQMPGSCKRRLKNSSAQRAVCRWTNAPTACWRVTTRLCWIRYSSGLNRWICPSNR
jgi:hypothetical protein